MTTKYLSPLRLQQTYNLPKSTLYRRLSEMSTFRRRYGRYEFGEGKSHRISVAAFEDFMVHRKRLMNGGRGVPKYDPNGGVLN